MGKKGKSVILNRRNFLTLGAAGVTGATLASLVPLARAADEKAALPETLEVVS